MDVFATDFEARTKSDHSPVSDADERAEEIILERLAHDLPGVPVLAEESTARNGSAATLGDEFLLVDPVDGTREFINRGTDFTVNIALIRNRVPVAGCVFAPARKAIWYGGAEARSAQGFAPGATLDPVAARVLHTRPRPAVPAVLLSSSHLDPETQAFVDSLGPVERKGIGSSLKFCLIADAEADIYPRWGPTMEWDTAAGHAVLAAAGGCVLTPEGQPFRYAKAEAGYLNGPFIAWGRPPG